MSHPHACPYPHLAMNNVLLLREIRVRGTTQSASEKTATSEVVVGLGRPGEGAGGDTCVLFCTPFCPPQIYPHHVCTSLPSPPYLFSLIHFLLFF
jgi:hypothetical protein